MWTSLVAIAGWGLVAFGVYQLEGLPYAEIVVGAGLVLAATSEIVEAALRGRSVP